jgi:hypothetical protein
MRKRWSTSRRAAALLLAASALGVRTLATSPARADGDANAVSQCIAQYDRAIALRRSGKLLQARTVLAQCGEPSCGADISDTCQKEAAAITAVIPTIVFATKDGSQHDIATVQLTIDSVPYAGGPGAAIPLDPGEHEFRFEVVGRERVVKRFVLLEGEHDRREAIIIGPPPSAQQPPPTGEPSSRHMNGWLVAGLAVLPTFYLLTVVGAAALTHGRCSAAATVPRSAIPIAGGLVSSTYSGDGCTPEGGNVAAGIVSVVAQAFGLTALTIGLVQGPTVSSARGAPAAPRLSPVVTVEPRGGSAGLGVVF